MLQNALYSNKRVCADSFSPRTEHLHAGGSAWDETAATLLLHLLLQRISPMAQHYIHMCISWLSKGLGEAHLSSAKPVISMAPQNDTSPSPCTVDTP